jgi:FAD/FMN-containing dehydrogenase
MDARFPPQHRYLADTVWSNEPAERVLAAAGPLLARAPSPKSMLLCVAPPPAPEAVMPDTAFSMVAGLLAVPYAIWEDAAADGVNRAWHDAVVAALEPFAAGHYLGEADIAARPTRAERSFTPSHWQRLQAVRRRYDPDGLFHFYFAG